MKTPRLAVAALPLLAACAASDLPPDREGPPAAPVAPTQALVWDVAANPQTLSSARALALYVDTRRDARASVSLTLATFDARRGARVLTLPLRREVEQASAFEFEVELAALDLHAEDGPVNLAVTGSLDSESGNHVPLHVPLDLRLTPRGDGTWDVRELAADDGALAFVEHEASPTRGRQLTATSSATFCVNHTVLFQDGGVGEDWWPSSTLQTRDARGAKVRVFRAGSDVALFDGYTDDATGCTPSLNVTVGASYEVQLYSFARMHGNTIYVVLDASGNGRYVTSTVSAAAGTNNVTFDVHADHRLNVAAAVTHSLYRRWAQLSGNTFWVRTDTQSTEGSHYERAADTLHIATSHFDNKFVISHEFGHLIGDFGTGNQNHKLVALPCSAVSDTTCPAARNEHSMASKEYAKCAAGEGFAHFYAAAVWNDVSENDCFFHYYKNEFGDDATPTINCRAGTAKWPAAYLDNVCGGTLDGYGVELDWMRAFYFVHSNGANAPEFAAVMNWIDRAASWGDKDVYEKLDAAANSVGGALNGNWDSAKVTNGLH